jgi:DNA-binding LytR/AlgR family response regulator
MTLDKIEKTYVGNKLYRVHRSFIVNADKVKHLKQIDNGQTVIDFNNRQIPVVPVARRRLKDLKNILGIGRSKPSF